MRDTQTVKAVPVGNLELNRHRTYLCIFADADPGTGVTVTIDGGTPFVIAAGTYWSPRISIISPIVMTGDGTMIVS